MKTRMSLLKIKILFCHHFGYLSLIPIILVLLMSLVGIPSEASEPWGTKVGSFNNVDAYSNGRTDYVYDGEEHRTYGIPYQCVEYVNRYYAALGHQNMKGKGNANEYYGKASSLGLTAYANGGTVSPQAGDILCSNGGGWGHIAIVREVTGNSVHVIQQNWYNDSRDNDMVLNMSVSNGHYTVGGFSASYPIEGWLRKPGSVQPPPSDGEKPPTSSDGEKPPTHNLMTSANPSDSGNVDPSGTHTYDDDTQVTLTATPNPDYRFDRWSEAACGSSNPVTLTMDRDINITAYFIRIYTYTLTTSVSPSAGGSVSPPSGTYDAGTQVALTATPNPNYRFERWSDDASGSSNPITITMDGNKRVTAYFKRQYTLTTSVSPLGSGRVTPSGDTYDEGTPVLLTAEPDPGYRFYHWSGDASGTSPTITITMDRDKNVIANFTKILTFDLKPGWNLISFSGTPVNPNPDSLKSQSPQIQLISAWDPEHFAFRKADKLEPCKGYWVLSLDKTRFTVEVIPTSEFVLSLKAGWNLIGIPNATIDFTNPQDDPDGSVLPPARFFDPDKFNYTRANQLEPMKGYWVLAIQDCTLTLKSSSTTSVIVTKIPTFDLKSGWNLISFPGTPVNPNPDSLKSQSPQIQLISSWDPEHFAFRKADKLESCKGYWVLSLDKTRFTVEVIPTSEYVLSLKAGWNLIGTPNAIIDFTNPQDNPDGSVLPPAHFFDPDKFNYTRANQLEPTKGYWVLALQDCTLTLNSSPPLPAAPSISPVAALTPAWTLPITVTGEEGITQSLTLGAYAQATEGFDPNLDEIAPPPVPQVMSPVQAYFPNNHPLFSRLTTDIKPLTEAMSWRFHVETPSNKATLSWDASNLPGNLTVRLDTGTDKIDMRTLSTYLLPAGMHQLTVTILPRIIPKVSKLLQNYPNPFNPETWIPYNLAQSAAVTIRIYNVMGQLIKTLHLWQKEAGVYTEKGSAAYWDGKNDTGEKVASGIYFYTIEAGSFRATKKLIVLK